MILWECGNATDQDGGPFTLPPLFGTSGTISLQNYANNHNQTWDIMSECDHVLITSEMFKTEEHYDFLTINGVKYRIGFLGSFTPNI